MSAQPEALWLVEVMPYLEGGERGQWIIDATAELRRLAAVEAQRDALLEALRAAVADWDEEVSRGRWLDAARAAIKAVEEEA